MNVSSKEVFDLFSKLQYISSTKSKFNLIKEFVNKSGFHSNYLKEIIKYTYDPNLIYGISISLDEIENIYPLLIKDDPWVQLLSLLKVFSFTPNSNNKRKAFYDLLGKMELKDRLWCSRIINKDLNIGVGLKTWFKIFPNLYYKFEVMLCDKLEKQTWKDERIIEGKYDGFRCIIIHNHNNATRFYSREGQVLNNLEHVAEELKTVEGSFVLDTEAIGLDFNSTQSILTTEKVHKNAKNISIKAFDYMPLSFWDNKDQSLTWEERRLYLDTLCEENKFKFISLSNYTRVLGSENAIKKCKELYASGYEGGVIKDPNGAYDWGKRSWLKWKPVFTEDLKIVGINMGSKDSKYSNMLGSLQVRGNIKWRGNLIEVSGNVSGMTEQDRSNLFDMYQKGNLIGKIVELEFQEVTKNKKDLYSIRFPQFQRLRLDKTI